MIRFKELVVTFVGVFHHVHASESHRFLLRLHSHSRSLILKQLRLLFLPGFRCCFLRVSGWWWPQRCITRTRPAASASSSSSNRQLFPRRNVSLGRLRGPLHLTLHVNLPSAELLVQVAIIVDPFDLDRCCKCLLLSALSAIRATKCFLSSFVRRPVYVKLSDLSASLGLSSSLCSSVYACRLCFPLRLRADLCSFFGLRL